MSLFGRFKRWRVSRRRFLIGGAGGVGLTVAWPVVTSRAFRLRTEGIRKAVSDIDDRRRAVDAQLINDYIVEAIPTARRTVEATAQLFDQPDDFIFIDDVAQTVCRVAIDRPNATVALVWWLPARARLSRLLPVFRATVLEVANENPEVADYRATTVTPDQRAAAIGQRFFPDADIARTDRGAWRITLNQFRRAKEEAELW